jgi:hypothetical protein
VIYWPTGAVVLEGDTQPAIDVMVLVWDSDHLKGQHLKLVKRSEVGNRDLYKPPFFPVAP